MSPTKRTEYYGTLRWKDSDQVLIVRELLYFLYSINFQLVTGYPVLWFREDGAGSLFTKNFKTYFLNLLIGGWSRLKNRLSSNGLAYQGSKVPTVATEIPAAIKEIIAAIESEGGDITTVPKKAMSFTV